MPFEAKSLLVRFFTCADPSRLLSEAGTPGLGLAFVEVTALSSSCEDESQTMAH